MLKSIYLIINKFWGRGLWAWPDASAVVVSHLKPLVSVALIKYKTNVCKINKHFRMSSFHIKLIVFSLQF